MAPIVVDNIVRYTVNGTYAGEAVANIVDMFLDPEPGGNRATDAFNQAGVIINQWFADILPNTVDDYVFTSVSWVDLDSLGGSTGERTSTGTVTLPQAGPSVEAPMPANVAVLVRKLAEGGRNVRNGRLYFVGVSESITTVSDPNNIQPTAVTTLQNAFTAFMGNIEQTTPYISDWRVVHAPIGQVPFSTSITAIEVDNLLATQRRRLPARS